MTQVVDRLVQVGTPPGAASEPPPASLLPARPAEEPQSTADLIRPALAIGCAMLAVAVMTGGSFTGWLPRVAAGVAGLSGVGLAVYTARTARILLAQSVSVVAIGALAFLAALTTGVDHLGSLGGALSRAGSEGRGLATPLDFNAEWRFLLVLVCAAAGYGAAWLATDLRRPQLGMLLALALIVFTAVAQPPSVQTVDAIASFALFAVAVAILYRDTGPDGGVRLSAGFEARRTGRAALIVGVVVVLLVVVSRADGLFPEPAINQSQAPQVPATVTTSALSDRVLFTVSAPPKAAVVGPWRVGVLDSYDGNNWRLPAVTPGTSVPAGSTRTVDAQLNGTVTQTFTIAGLDGPVLPTPPRAATIGHASSTLDYDPAVGAVRVPAGQPASGTSYTATSATLPGDAELKAAPPETGDPGAVQVPAAPAQVTTLLAGAPASGWERADWVRRQLIGKVKVTGTGGPQSVPAARVVDMLAGGRSVNPYEFVAAEALLERWAGIPARIGYGYEGGDARPDGGVDVHPRNAAAWLELDLHGLGWIPVTGGPASAGTTGGGGGGGGAVALSPDIAIQLFVPVDEVSPVPDYQQIRAVAFVVGVLLLLGAATYFLWPLPYKAFRRARRRSWARGAGAMAMVAVAYAEFREQAIDLGDTHQSETPLRFLDLVMPDAEHTELAWLVTRVLWGDLVPGANEAHAAQVLSRSLRSRLGRAQPLPLQLLAAISRLSLRHPYWQDLERGVQRVAA